MGIRHLNASLANDVLVGHFLYDVSSACHPMRAVLAPRLNEMSMLPPPS
jgi:hypothetical protein